jgi:very-short-patch-repair endonuclease
MLSKEGYYSCKIYSRLINELFIQGPYSVNFQQLITSLHGISKFHYFCERLKGLFKNVVENSIQSAGYFEVKNILRIMILQNYYDEQVLNITLEKFKELTDSRITLDNYSYHVLMQLKLDCPEKSEVLNKFLERIKPGPLEAHMLSKTHGYISEILKSFNYEYKESVVIFNVYEADFLIEKEKIIVDAIGTLYHFANTDYILSPKELIRIKHLVKLGYKVILTVNRESTVKNLKKAIFVLTHFKNQNLVVLTENKLEFFDVFGNIKLLNG